MSEVDLFLVGTVVFFMVGILAEFLFRKTKVPDALWLILIGFVVGPVLKLVSIDVLSSILPFFASIALIVILFDGGSKLRLSGLRDTLGRCSVLAIVGFLVTMVGVALVSWLGVWLGLLQDWSWTKAFIMGCILGGASSIVIMPTMQSSHFPDRVSTLVSVESAITDALCIVGTSLMVAVALQAGGAGSSSNFTELLVQTLGVGLLGGVLAGLLWLLVLPFMKGRYDYMVTFSFLILIYVVVNQLGGSPAFAILIFAVQIGNARILGKVLRMGEKRSVSYDVKFLNNQLAFVVKTFFFLLVGILLKPSFSGLIVASLLTGMILLTRWPATLFSLSHSDFTRAQKKVVWACSPRGLAAGVLATVPFQMGLTGMERLQEIVFLVVALSIILFSVLLFKYDREMQNEAPEPTDVSPAEDMELPVDQRVLDPHSPTSTS